MASGPAGMAGRALLLLVRPIVIGLRRTDGELRLQLQKVLLADTADVHQVLDLLERTVFLAVLDDEGGGAGADAGQRVELGGGCSVDVDHRARGGLDRDAGGWRLCLRERRGWKHSQQ